MTEPTKEQIKAGLDALNWCADRRLLIHPLWLNEAHAEEAIAEIYRAMTAAAPKELKEAMEE